MPVIAGALALVVTLGATSCASQLDETDRALVEAMATNTQRYWARKN